MIVYLQDRFVPAGDARVSVFDRGFLYGDGLFETIRAAEGRLLFWDAHQRRLDSGLAALGITLSTPPTTGELRALGEELLRRNGLDHGILRITVSRGPGARGYSPRNAGPPTLVMTAHPGTPLETLPQPPRTLATSTHRLPIQDPLSAVKSASRLLHVLARRDAEDRGAEDALLLDSLGRVAETSSANLFWFTQDSLRTPDLTTGALPGVTRAVVMEIAQGLGWPVLEVASGPESLRHASGAFVTLATLGLVEVAAVDGLPLPSDPRFTTLLDAYRQRLRSELIGPRPPTQA